jgi:hypothetical protein
LCGSSGFDAPECSSQAAKSTCIFAGIFSKKFT